MAEKIYIRNASGELEPLAEERFETEAMLEELVAQHPELLAGEQMRPGDPLRWILIKPQMQIEGWAVDLLLIDQHGRPTLVEVKRGSNSQIRREVVGQMLDYAATAAGVWSERNLRQVFEDDAKARGDDPYDELREFLNPKAETDQDDFASEFWNRVATNLATNQLWLLFVSDDVPTELERIVEFLNSQMPNIDVLAVEIKQFRSCSMQTLVPRIIGKIDTVSTSPAGAKVNVVKGKTQYVGQEGQVVKVDPGGGILVKFADGQQKWLSQNSVTTVG